MSSNHQFASPLSGQKARQTGKNGRRTVVRGRFEYFEAKNTNCEQICYNFPVMPERSLENPRRDESSASEDQSPAIQNHSEMPYTDYQMAIAERLIEQANGNTGALTVLGTLWRMYGSCIADIVKQERISGEEIWAIYVYKCGEDPEEMFRNLALGEATKWLDDSWRSNRD